MSFAISATSQLDVIRRKIARRGVGSRAELEQLLKAQNVGISTTTAYEIINGDVEDPSFVNIEAMGKALTLVGDRPPKGSDTVRLTDEQLSAYTDMQRQLEAKLRFEDYILLARFAKVDRKKLCWLRGGFLRFEGVDYVYQQLKESLDAYLAWKAAEVDEGTETSSDRGAGMTDASQESNGHTPAAVLNGINGHAMYTQPVSANVPAKPDAASVEVTVSPASYRRSPRDQMVYDRMVRLGAWTPFSVQRKFFVEVSGLSELTVQKFFKGDTSPRIATLEMIEAALDRVEERYPVSEVQSEPALDSLEPTPEESGQEPILQPSVPDDEESLLAPEVESSGEVEPDALVQAAQLLGISLEDEQFRTYFSALSEAVAKQSRGEVQLVQTKAIVREDRIRWQVTLGDIDLENPN